MQHRENNLDALRLAAALTVVVGHAWPLTGLTDGAPRVAGILAAHLAVFTFFSISGYLIATSWRQSPRAVPFLSRRVARIFPALFAVVLITQLVVGPLLSRLPASAYFASPATWRYLSGLVLAPSYALPGVFSDNPTTAVNGSLWTLGPEFICYLIVLVVGLSTLVMRNGVRWVRPLVFAALAISLGLVFWLTPDKPTKDAVGAMAFFAIGAVCAYLPITRLPLWALVPVALVWLASGTVSRDVGVTVGWIAVPILVLSLGLRSAPIVRRVGRFGDFSYGTYLWAFPVQQAVVLLVPKMPLVLDILVVVAITGALAFASWHLIEHRALAQVRTFWAARKPASRDLAAASVPHQ
ncbi:MAG: acyltransferase [Pseudolysinimonas sp.]